MSEKEKQILEVIAAAIPNMSDFYKGYFLGVGETMANQKKALKMETNAEDNKLSSMETQKAG